MEACHLPRGCRETKFAVRRRLTRPCRHGSNEGVVSDVEEGSLLRVEDHCVVVAHRPEPHGPTEVLVPGNEGNLMIGLSLTSIGTHFYLNFLLESHFAELDSLPGVVDVDGLPRLGPVPSQDAEQLPVRCDQGAVAIPKRNVVFNINSSKSA